MSFATTKIVELARINLAFAQAEIIGSKESPEYLERVLSHIGEADAFLSIVAPEFDDYPSHPDTEVTEKNRSLLFEQFLEKD